MSDKTVLDELLDRFLISGDAYLDYIRQQICNVYSLPYSALFGGTNMEPWKERFVTEYNELMDRMLKLDRMLQEWETGRLDFEPKCPKKLLQRQLEVMAEYLYILDNRARIEGIEV